MEHLYWVWSGQGNLAAKNETLTWGDPFTRTLGATGSNQSQDIVMLARHWSFVSGSMVPSYASIVEFSYPSFLPYFWREQFRGRAVRASCDPLDPGRFLFGGKFLGETNLPSNSGFS
jgi:hypothetical protein